jgi:hypothetical protein
MDKMDAAARAFLDDESTMTLHSGVLVVAHRSKGDMLIRRPSPGRWTTRESSRADDQARALITLITGRGYTRTPDPTTDNQVPFDVWKRGAS